MAGADLLAVGAAALGSGRWDDARAAYEAVLAEDESAEASLGVAAALWWLGESRDSVARCTHAYALYRRSGDAEHAVRCAVWLAITYKSNYGNHTASDGWTARADRLLEGRPTGPLHGWTALARAYKLPDLDAASLLTRQALEIADAAEDLDLEIVARAQLGLIHVGQGDGESGFALIDEAMAGALAGEGSSLDTVVYACCDMLTACDLTSDLERAAQWCRVADDFVDAYGCPFLYAECRILYGRVLVSKGRWEDAERHLWVGLRIAEDGSPVLHAKALVTLASLRIRQGRAEEARELLSRPGVALTGAEGQEADLVRATLMLVDGHPAAAARLVGRVVAGPATSTLLGAARALLVEASTLSGDLPTAREAAQRLTEAADAAPTARLRPLADTARGRVALAEGDADEAVRRLEAAVSEWVAHDLLFEAGRARFDLARAVERGSPEAAVDQARQALAGLDLLGARSAADEVSAWLRERGVVPPAGPRALGALTRREQEVLRLVGAGLSNPEIAERLFVSRKTASHHVSRILAKLDLRNRAEAAAYAAALGAADRGALDRRA